METETTETGVPTETGTEDGGSEVETLAIPKKDYETLNQTLGSLKRELKDLKKSKEEPKETSQTKTDESALLQKLERMSFRQAGLTHQDDIELARTTAKKWGVDVDDVLTDEDFKVKLERQQTKRTNELATSDVRGGQGPSQAKNSPEYWLKLGKYPSKEDLPNRKQRVAVLKAFQKKEGGDGTSFYNE